MIDWIVKLYRRMNSTARSVVVLLLAFVIAMSTLHVMTFPATALTRQAGESDPGIVIGDETNTEGFDNASEGENTDVIPVNTEVPPTGEDTTVIPEGEAPAPADTTVNAEPTPESTEATEPTATPDVNEEAAVIVEPTATPEVTPTPEPTETPTAEEEPEEESDSSADVETAADWEDMFRDVELTGVWADDLLTLAELQKGYKESEKNFVKDDEGKKYGYTRYGEWYGDPYAEWDSLFVMFNLYYAGITKLDFPYQADCEDWIDALQNAEMFHEVNTYVPNKGDLVFADVDEDGEADHVAIVKAVEKDEAGNPDKLIVIEGDIDNEVKESTYEFYNPLITGFAQLPENPEMVKEAEAVEDAIAEEPEAEPVYQTFTGRANSVVVTVEYEEGAFPEGTIMQVSTVRNTDVLNAINDTITDKEIVKVQAVDIKFIYNKQEIEPSKPIKVTMKSTSIPKQAEEAPTVVHVDDELNTEVVEAEQAEEAKKPTEAVTFESGAFSVYAIVYTVDFAYSLDGRVFTFSMEGETSMKLSALVEALGIIEETSLENGKAFVAEVQNVEFTDSTLLKVKKDFFSNDWTLTSLAPFTSQEALTITMNNGNVFTIDVTDAQYTTDLNSLLTAIDVKLNGTSLKDGDKITVDKGDKFEMHLEISENDFYQFPDDSTGMVYQLPDGINLGETFTKYININLGIDGKVYRNPLVYDKDSNTLTLKWNTNDPKFDVLTSTDNTKVVIDLSGYFNEDANHIKWTDDLEIDVEHKEHHDADIQKAGQLFLPGAEGNPYGNQPAIKYTVTVTSDGTTTVNVNDVVEGTAVTLDTTNWTATSNKGTTITPSFSNKGFDLNNQSMQDEEVITITYWGKVDTSEIENLRNVTYTETGNKVKLTGEGIPEKEKTHYEHEVSDNKMSKSAEHVGDIDENGMQTVTWKIVANNNPIESIGGSTITDRISADSRAYMSYSGDGIAVVAKRPDGTIVLNSTYYWNTSNLEKVDTDQDKHWTFTIPETNEALTYEITYTTEVDTTKHPRGLFTVVNNTEGKPGTGSGSATVGVPDTPEPQPVNYTKKAVSVSEDEVVWNISINIDQADSGYRNPFVLTDYIPSHAFGDIGYTDDFESVEVEGLNDTEWYAISYNYSKRDDNAWKKSGDNVKPTDVILTFYRDGIVDGDVQNKNGQNNTANPGIGASTNRTLTVKVVTKNSENWLKLAAEEGITHQDYLQHTNKAKINEYNTVEDTVSPMAKVVYKMRDGKREVSGDSGTAHAYIHVNDDLTLQDTVKGQLPAYKFWIMVGGVAESNLTDSPNGKQLIIEDSFDPLFRILFDGEDKPVRFSYGTSPTSFDEKQPDASKGESFTWSQTSDGKATFILTNPRKNGDNYYPYYAVEYWLIPKNEEALSKIRQAAMDAGGTVIFKNDANSGDSSDNLNFTFTYNILDKSSVAAPDPDTGITFEKYTIKINPDKLKLNDGNNMTLTDKYSDNLSVDFGSINVTAYNKNNEDVSSSVTWDYRSHTGTFVIPDETSVVITYNARIVGDPGSVQTIKNTAYMEGYSDSVVEERMIGMSGEGSAEKIRVRLLKFAADHMEEGLNGAQFRLLDQDKHPVLDKNGNEIIYTTTNGYLNKLGVVHAKTDKLDYVYDENTQQYKIDNLWVYDWSGQLTEAAKIKAHNGQIANPATSSDQFVTYEDLSAQGMKDLGINFHAGFAEITLSQKDNGIALKKERVYYLQEITTPTRTEEDGSVTHFEKDFTQYSFLITEQSDYTAPGGVYVYHNNDVVTVRNWPSEDASLKISKTFTGNAELTDAQKNSVTFRIQKKNNDSGEFEDFPVAVWDAESGQIIQTATVKYGDKKDAAGTALFENGVLKITGIDAGVYRVIESNQNFGDYVRSTEYLVDGDKQEVVDEEQGVSVTVTQDDVTNKVSHDIAITNSYFTNKYEITKVAADTAEVLGNAEFKIVGISDQGVETDIATGIKTESNGKFSIKWKDNDWNPEYVFSEKMLYYVVETAAPVGYITPDNPDKYYFYYSSDPADPNPDPWSPGTKSADNPGGLPSGETAVDLTIGFGSAMVPNRRDVTKTFVKIDKKWVNSMGKDITANMPDSQTVTVKLYRTTEHLSAGTVIDDGDKENPKQASDTRTLTINWQGGKVTKVSFIPGDRIQLTMRAIDEEKKIQPHLDKNDIEYTTRYISGGEWSDDLIKILILNTTSAGQNPVINVSDNGNLYSLVVNNLETAQRVYKLTQEEAQSIQGEYTENVVTLNKGNNWTQTVSDLPMVDANNAPYFYYTIEDGEYAQSTTSYDVGSKTITVTNVAPDSGALKITKAVSVKKKDGTSASDSTAGDGDYVFKVESGSTITPAVERYVLITVKNGKPISYKVANTQDALARATAVTGSSAIVSGLAEGEYKITEINKNGLKLIRSSRGDGDTSKVGEDGAVTVYVTAGNDKPGDDSSAAAVFTNEKKITDFEFTKKWIDTSGDEIEWDKTIEVTVKRDKAPGSVDTTFSLKYEIDKDTVINATDGKADFTSKNTSSPNPDPILHLTITTTSEGKKIYTFKLDGLDCSSESDEAYIYWVIESNRQLDGYIEPRYSNKGAETAQERANDEGTIINRKEGGAVLPKTGGSGTGMITILGSILILTGAGVLLLRRRKESL